MAPRMGRLFLAVLLSAVVGPGIGQLFNREFKKGWILIGISLVVLLAFLVWVGKAAVLYVPAGIEKVDLEMARQIRWAILRDHPVVFRTYQGLLIGVWLIGVVDAFLGAWRRRQATPRPPA
ncbi:MAG: hypothetical protein HYZ73_06650 [Elusimicrobia bacterium]|nr:hypothetical protein [Elusimicrobiota bacterium]